MEQLYPIFVIIILTLIIFFSAFFLYKKSPKLSIIPPISTAVLTVIIIFIARAARDWSGLVYGVLGAMIGLATIVASIVLLIFHIVKKNQSN